MPIQFSPDDFQNNDFQLAQNNAGDLVLEHKQTGGRFKFDATTDSWVPVQGLDLQGADIVNVGASQTDFAEKADLTSSNGVLQSSQLPDLAITNIDVVANQSERLSLTAEEGDVAVQTDVSQTFILSTNDPTVNSNWKQIQLDVLGAIDGQTITPAQTGTSSNRTDVVANNVDANTVTGDTNVANRQGCRVVLSSAQSISRSTNLKVQFDSTVYDSDNNFDTSTHNWTCPKDGLYMATVQLRFNGGNNDERRDVAVGSGSTIAPSGEGARNRQHSTDSGDILQATSVNKYTTGDTIAAHVRNSSSSDTISSGQTANTSYFEVAFLGGL